MASLASTYPLSTLSSVLKDPSRALELASNLEEEAHTLEVDEHFRSVHNELRKSC